VEESKGHIESLHHFTDPEWERSFYDSYCETQPMGSRGRAVHYTLALQRHLDTVNVLHSPCILDGLFMHKAIRLGYTA
jgi:hypothetical protein